MVRRLAFFLVLLLSLQWSSSAISAMCMHEGTAQEADHLGHHAHSHDSAVDEAATHARAASLEAGAIEASSATPDGDLQPHPDCAGCHLTASPVLPAAAAPDQAAPSGASLLPAPSTRAPCWAADSPFRPPRA